eukprot:403347478
MQASTQSPSSNNGGGASSLFNLDCSLFGITMDQLEFDFYSNYNSGNLMSDEPITTTRMRLDSEYVWEGEEMMYEDIVASTQPLNYFQNRKRIDDFQFHMSNYNHEDPLQDLNEMTQHIEMPNYQVNQQEVCENTCGRNQENEDEQFGLDSTIITNLEFNQSLAPYHHELNFDMIDIEQQDSSMYFENYTNQQVILESSISGGLENSNQIQNSLMGQQSSNDIKGFLPTNPRCHLRGPIPDTPLLKHIIPGSDTGEDTAYFYEEAKGCSSSHPFDYTYSTAIYPQDIQTSRSNSTDLTMTITSSPLDQSPIPKTKGNSAENKEPQKKKLKSSKFVKNTVSSQNIVEEVPTQEHTPDKYYKKFDFFYKRTCFRLMAEFFKSLFQPFQKMWIEQKKKSPMTQLLHSFAVQHFESTLSKLPPGQQIEFIGMLMAVVHSHRHNKEDSFLSESSVDFSLMRDTMYKYSKKAQERFFSIPVFAYLFAWFASSPEGINFTQKKFLQKGQDYFVRMKKEIDELKDEAIDWLKKQSPSKNDMKYQIFLQQLNIKTC